MGIYSIYLCFLREKLNCIMFFIIVSNLFSLFFVIQPNAEVKLSENYGTIETMLIDTEISLNILNHSHIDRINIQYT